MATAQQVEIVAVGMTTPAGLGAQASAAAIRAGITRIRTSTIHLSAWEGQRMGLLEDKYLPPLEPAVDDASKGYSERHRRMLQLATLAFRELTATWTPPWPPPLMLALPEVPAVGPDPIGSAFLRHLEQQAGVRFDVAHSRLFRNGRAGGLLALQHAFELLAARQIEYAYVGGIDTYLELGLLNRLDREQRLLADGRMEGFIPGEAAAFLLLTLPRVAKSAGLEPVAHLLSTGTGKEEGHLYSTRPHLGDGLADSLRSAFDALPERFPPVRTIYAGMNGERIWGREWGVAYMRNKDHIQETYSMEHPAEYIGDPGAALGTLMVGLGAIALQKKYRQGPCLVWCGSDHQERAAAVLHAKDS